MHFELDRAHHFPCRLPLKITLIAIRIKYTIVCVHTTCLLLFVFFLLACCCWSLSYLFLLTCRSQCIFIRADIRYYQVIDCNKSKYSQNGNIHRNGKINDTADEKKHIPKTVALKCIEIKTHKFVSNFRLEHDRFDFDWNELQEQVKDVALQINSKTTTMYMRVNNWKIINLLLLNWIAPTDRQPKKTCKLCLCVFLSLLVEHENEGKKTYMTSFLFDR